ncbi:copper-binding protein [Ramlibacter sp. MAHUQ-53]|uniref:copper-binding protein n=1 Tax=unclassified Ramlibacter TaxID=2617605 RepID=UPI0036383B2B
MTTLNTLALAGLLSLALPAWSQATDHSAHHPAAEAPAAGFATGEVRRIDKPAGKLTLRHGEIASLQMPPMTMVFVASDPAMLDTVKVGDKVQFRADQQGGVYRVIELKPAQ